MATGESIRPPRRSPHGAGDHEGALEIGPAAVQTVQESLAPERKLAYNTVQTMLNVLQRKGKVTASCRPGLPLRPRVSRVQPHGRPWATSWHRMFDGSAESLVLSLVEAAN